MGITVAALMTSTWVARSLHPVAEATKVILPGYCLGDLACVEHRAGIPVERGPKDLRRLPEYFGGVGGRPEDYGAYDVEIVAEVNMAPRLGLAELIRVSESLVADGADVIDLGCSPDGVWTGIADAVTALRDHGWRVSVDSLNPREISMAAKAGAELVLSVNSSNVETAGDWGCEVVVIPDEPKSLSGLDATLEKLATKGVPFRIDPIVEPIGFGFAQSLGRYLETRRRYPDSEMLMGIGNLTELTDVDSAGVNVLLLGFCQELGIRSVLTTQVIHWARTSVKECDLARRLVHYAVTHGVLPKHLEPALTVLRDPRVPDSDTAEFERLAAGIKDHNFRLFATGDAIHAVTAGQHWSDTEPFRLFERMHADASRPIDAAHAFYLGYEMAKAMTALTLAKEYRQDEALNWGFLTRPETSHRGRTKDADANSAP